MYIKWMDTYIITRVLTSCCCAGCEEGVIEDVKRDKCAHKVDGYMNKNKGIYLQLPVVVQVVVNKVPWRM